MAIELPDFKHARVLVLGDLMLDYYWHGESHRVSPEAPVPVMHFNAESWRLGGAANVALNCKALGASVQLLGMIGQDDYGEQLIALLEQEEIHAALTRVPYLPTTTKLRILAQNQQLLRVDFEKSQPLELADHKQMIKQFESALQKADVVILSDYQKGVLFDPKPFIQLANQYQKPVLVDPKGTDFSLYKGASVLTPNQKEFETVYGSCVSQEELYKKANQANQDLGLEVMLVTQGKDGVSLIQENHVPFHIGARQLDVVDITGAGDTFIATFATALASGAELLESCMIANIAAGISVKKSGTAEVTYEELYLEQQGFSGMSQVILSVDDLAERVSGLKKRHKKIVMTNGCFDLLHPGHIHYLQQAQLLGDCLVVAVNDDDSVKRLKGSGRPKHTIENRCQALANLRCVDFVVPFSEDTPEELIKKIQPDFLVKGGDYKEDSVVGKSLVEAYGGQVRILDYIDGISTTKLLRMIEQEK